ncbi:cadherin-23 isoform X2 [Condylostylus longicornis]|uniref:cadherin-23 isoform X2 n=1 Tax=Condylostylus longicornis TaxID=2530218 RepID=UPI00244DE52E|nr:cadherin-23 isoform X2 [Condylostylus longicornis]
MGKFKNFTRMQKNYKNYKKVKLKSKAYYASYVLSVLLILFINISLANANRPPRFVIRGQTEIVLRLKESPETPVGTLIYHVRGYDPDNDVLTFGVKPSQDSDVIKIENSGKNEANIYLAKELDRETKDEYSIVLTLTDNHFGEDNYVTQSFLLLVEDINDNEPIFRPYQTAVEIPENSPTGIITALEATDRDEGAYGQVVYYLQELDGDNEIFSIATYQGKGILRLVGNLDYERKSLYQLRILAIDRANQGRVNTGTAAILVKVKDIEDQPPEFIHTQSVARISEDAAPGTKVLQVKAIDGDRGVNNKIKYSIEKNNIFNIEEDTGVIFTTTNLDRENDQVFNGAYILKVLAVEVTKQSPPPYVRTEITIIITDINDEKPTFKESTYSCEINENAQLNSPVHFLNNAKNEVFDHDVGNNGTFRLFIDPDNDIFKITPELAVNEASFLITVKNPDLLDYENVNELNFTIVAEELAPERKWSTAEIQLFIRDLNDNFPEFLGAPYEISILENIEPGTAIAQIRAIDKDSGDYGTTGIRFTHLRGGISHLLNLDPITGLISIQANDGNAFDREMNLRHYLTIEARDNLGRGNQNTAQLIINIEDVNDNVPTFFQQKYEAKLLENNLNFEIPLYLEARDNDLNGTENSDITFEIVGGLLTKNFTIDPKTGQLKPKTPIDFEDLQLGYDNIQAINLTVRARDSGMPILWSDINVTIYIQDINDNTPIFEKNYYSKVIPEDLPAGSSILAINALDRDGSKPNNLIVYRIQSGAADKFIINADTGVIYTADGANLDPDFTSPRKVSYSLVVVALDGGLGDSQLSSTTFVNITIKDVNNKIPVFTEFLTLKIKENTPVGTVVYRIIATDLDESPILRYRINKKNSEARTDEGIFVKLSEYDFVSAFELNSVTGLLKVAKLIDREKVEQIKLAIVVEDLASATGPQLRESLLTIQIEDENDNNPKFKLPFYKRSVPENSMNGVTIGNVVAFDLDKNRTITYFLEGDPRVTGLLHLDPETGEVVVANKIDHEEHQWLNFTVRATDSGYPPRSSLVDVFVSVLDENDNNPYFITTTKNFTILENSPIGTRIATIQAADSDSGDYGKITFLMDRISSQGKFTIDADTGVLTTADKIDRETKDFYVLVVEAWDNYQFGYAAGESRNTFKQIFVNVLDENDSPPELSLPIGCVQITEYHDTKEVIATIRGKDADDPQLLNGRIEMTIIKGNEESLFQLTQSDAWTGQLYARKSLKNKYGNHSLTISARDLGTPSNVVKKSLDICVSDFNDHPPVFISPAQNTTIRVPENATIGSLIIQVYATDEDVGLNALVRYKLKSDPLGNYRSFEIDSETGMLFLKEKLDRMKQKIYEIRIEAYDQGVPTSLSSDLDLAIYVRNVNDYEPQFLVEQISVNFTEHTEPGYEKIKLPDTIERDEIDDLDDPPSTVCYFIIQGNEENLFALDQETHILSVVKELDREVKSNHTLYIKATESCSSPTGNQQEELLLREESKNSKEAVEIFPLRLSTNYRKINSNRFHNYFNRYKQSRKLRSLLENSNVSLPLTMTDESLMSDGTVVRVFIKVLDINDNQPRFISKIFTGGFTTTADFGTKFMKVEAYDADDIPNALLNYYQVGEIRQTLTEGLENVENTPFLVDQITGDIQLNFDPQKGMKGYFDFMVLVNDTGGLKDTAHVFIYLLRDDQKVKFVFRQHPQFLRNKIHRFRDALSNVSGAIVNIDEFKVHENKDGSVDKTKTDLYMHLVDKEDNSIYEVDDVLNLIDKNVEKLDDLFKEFNVLDTQAAETELLVASISKGPMYIWLIFSNIFIATFLVIVLILCASQRRSYKRQLRAAKVNIYNQTSYETAPRESNTRVPNTNKHSIEGSNPIWLKGYENEWFKNDDDQYKNSDSFDENILAAAITLKPPKMFDGTNDLNRTSNSYNQINKLTNNAQMLIKRLETTEL